MNLMVTAGLLATLASPYAEKRAAANAAAMALEYPSAAVLWEEAVSLAATEDERIESHLGAGVARRIVGDDVDARLHFVYVLKRQPDIVLDPSHPPRIRDFFELIRDEILSGNESKTPAPAEAPSEATGFTASTLVAGGAAALAVAAAGVGVGVGLSAKSSDERAFEEELQLRRLALYEQRDREAATANVAFVLAGAFGVVALGALFWPSDLQ